MKKLLIVDDNLDFLGFLVSILKQHFEVYEASGVKEALQVLENTEIEAVCADFNMNLSFLNDLALVQKRSRICSLKTA